MGKALYRKYRPRSLSEIIGQEHITNVLEKILNKGTPSHAYLLVGPRGTGKTSVARILAHAVNGFDYQLEDEHLDIIEIDAASNTGVDNIRELREKAIIAPSYGKYKVYIIDEVHMLSRSAFNALLKTLEEPPSHVIFIMATTDAHKVPITITSRSQVFTFKLANHETMARHLRFVADQEKIKITDNAIDIIMRHGGGSFRDSISLLDQISTISTGEITCEQVTTALGLPSDEITRQLLTHYSAGDLTSTASTLKELRSQGIKPENIAENLIAAILEHPSSKLLTLLDKLTEVSRASFPEVKLLLAFAGDNLPASSQTITTNPIATDRSPKTIKPIKSKTTESTNPTPKPRPEDETAEETSSSPTPPQVPAETLDPNSTNFWTALLTNINQAKPLVCSNLEQCEHVISKQKLTLYANNAFRKGQLDKNRSLILQNLPDNFELEIIASSKPSDNPTISAIIDIMGGGEEVTING